MDRTRKTNNQKKFKNIPSKVTQNQKRQIRYVFTYLWLITPVGKRRFNK